MKRTIAALLVFAGTVQADPDFELGQSHKRGPWRDPNPQSGLQLVPVVGKYGGTAGWEPELYGFPMEHERFYELVGRPELARRYELRRDLGALAIVAGIATAVAGAFVFPHDHDAGYAMVGGAFVIGNVGAYFVSQPDPIDLPQAHALLVGSTF